MASTNKIIVGIDDQQIELKGADKEAFLANQELQIKERELIAVEFKAKQHARESAIKKLADIAGLTKEELASIL
jgi:hypothetical protein